MNQLYDQVVAARAGLSPGPILEESQLDSFPEDSSPAAVFRREGVYWTIGFERITIRMKDAKGLHYLRRLLAAPGRGFHVLDLAAGTTPSPTRRAGHHGTEGRPAVGTDAQEMLDPAAKAAYRDRIEPGERARSNVSKSLRACVKRIEKAHPALGAHLATTVRTGYFCSYKPDPHAPVEWRT